MYLEYLLTTVHQQARRVKAQAEKAGAADKLDIEYESFNTDFDVCAASYTPIYGGTPSVACPFDGSKYHVKHKGQVCRICEVCEIGKDGSGLRLWVEGM